MDASLFYEGWTTDTFLSALKDGFLRDIGWLKSTELRLSVDGIGPVPWITYPCLRFISDRLPQHCSVLEFGSGSSTTWWAQRGSYVVSVEHDEPWRNKVSADLAKSGLKDRVTLLEIIAEVPPQMTAFLSRICLNNVEPEHEDFSYAAYAATPLASSNLSYDVIVIDGRGRNACAYTAHQLISPSGIIIFDNTDREDYEVGLNYLREEKYFRIDFWGLGPINPYQWCTSILFRDPSFLAR